MKENRKIKCDYIYPYIVSEVSFSRVEDHLKECEICSDRLKNIDRIMSILDEPVEVPIDLVKKTIQRKASVPFPVKPGLDYSKYLQMAAVLTAAVFLGVFLGRNANSNLLVSKKYKKDKALIEYRESHLLNNDNSFYKL